MNASHADGLAPEVKQKIKTVLQTYPLIEKAVLYGSRAKGNFKTGSDIDLTLMGRDLSLSLLLQVENDLDELLLPYKIDLSIYSLLDNDNLKDHIQRVGIVFYLRE